MDTLNLIPISLDEELVQDKRHTMIGINPIAPKYQVPVNLYLHDKEGCDQSIAPNGDPIDAIPLVGIRLASSNTAAHHSGLH
jgi:hypothetical protein